MKPEAQSILKYLQATKVPHKVTSIDRPGAITTAGNQSCHDTKNTQCAAVDVRGPSGGRFTQELLDIFWAFEPVFHKMNELILAHPALNFNIRNGKRVKPYAVKDHPDHVHVSIDTGVRLEEDMSQEDVEAITKRIDTLENGRLKNMDQSINAIAGNVQEVENKQTDQDVIINHVNKKVDALLQAQGLDPNDYV